MLRNVAPLPSFVPFPSTQSPELVRVFDRIRSGPLGDLDEFAEFCWFIREYPRIYRHHVDHAEHRLSLIAHRYARYHARAVEILAREPDNSTLFEMTVGSNVREVASLYWDFECYLSAISSALDVATRIVGTAFRKQTPANFNRFCKSAPDSELMRLFQEHKSRWVNRLKSYRDCFVHFTPVDTMLLVQARLYPDCWQVRARIPINPNAREILAFRFSRRVELFQYACTVWRHLRAFDRAVAKLIWRDYRAGRYPVRTSNLFFLGQRTTE